jgi:hypothetical protein
MATSFRPDRRTAGAEKEVAMPAVPLPERPSLEQLKKQARLLQRSVRSGHPKALALVAEHQPGRAAAGTFSLDSAQFVLARSYGFASWPKLRQHLATLVLPPEPASPRSFVLTAKNRSHARPGWADEADIKRCASMYPELGEWRPQLTVHHNGVTVVAFATAAGPRFCELTPTTITLSRPGDVPPPAGQATLTFHTASGTMAGVVAPEVTSLSLERPTDLMARQYVVILDGIFVVPNAFTVTPAGLVFRVNHNRTGDIVAADALPGRAAGVVDQPAPQADRESPAGQRLAAAIAAADAPPVVDPGQWVPGVYLELTDAEQVQLGRYGNLLGWYTPGQEDGLFVFEFGPQQCPLGEFAVVGETITATRFYYDFRDNSSGTVAVVGLVNDDRVASITLSRSREPDAEATLGGGTFVIPAIVGLSETSSHTRLTARDAAGNELERLPYRQNN